jgi:hypothetical protein
MESPEELKATLADLRTICGIAADAIWPLPREWLSRHETVCRGIP